MTMRDVASAEISGSHPLATSLMMALLVIINQLIIIIITEIFRVA